MSSSVRVLDFFVVEATEYIDQMDATLDAARPGAGAPNVDALMAAAHRLRGSATMARQTAIAAVAAGVERVARVLREKRLPWDAASSAALVAAVDDLRLLVRGARSWSSLEEQRARVRGEELARLAPPGATPQGGARPVGSRSGFLAAETLELSRALDAVVPGANPAVIGSATERVRALRGVADVRDMPPLPEVMEALETTLKSMELAGAARPCGPKEAALFSASAAVLRRVSRDLGASGRPAPDMTEMVAFEAALAGVSDETGRADRIVPIAELFAGDGSSGVVSAATHPPTTPAERFRLEVVSLAEHLRGVVAEARAHRAGEQRDRSSRDVRNAVRALGATANSFGEKVVARFAAEWSTRASALEEGALAALDAAAALFTNPDLSASDIARGLERLGTGTTTARPTPMVQAAQSPPARPTPPAARVPAPAAASVSSPALPAAASAAPPAPNAPGAPAAGVARGRVRTPTGPALRALLQDGLTGLSNLETTPLSEPAVIPDADVVPIESLFYRGRSALARAAELREQIKREGDPPSRESVQELFDLIDLALVE